MISINVDISEVIEQFDLKFSQIDSMKGAILAEMLNVTHENWAQQARLNLRSTRTDYINGLRLIEEGKLSGSIVLFGKLNNMIEQGCSPFDMKLGFSKSAKIKRSKKGNWYLHIPFRYGTSAGADEVMPIIPKGILEILQKEGRITEKNLPKDALSIGKTRPGAGKFKEYKHKTSIFMGIQRQDKVYEKSVQSTYVSFRTAGQLSDPNSWIHKGFKASRFAEKAVSGLNYQGIAENVANRMLESYGF